MKHNWEYKRLGDVCNIKTGKLDANSKEENGKYPFFTCDASPYAINQYAFDDEAILISGNGSNVGHVHYYKGKFNAYQRTYVLTQFQSFNILFLKHFIKQFIRPHIFAHVKGGCIPFITMPILTSFMIPCPPKETQERIVAELDKINELIEAKREQLKQLDALAQSIFYTMFGDPVTNPKVWKKSEIGKLSKVTSSKRIYQSELTEHGVPFYKISDFTNLIVNGECETDAFITKEKYELLKKTDLVPSQNDLLITSRGTLGLCYVCQKDDVFYFQDGMITWLKHLDKSIHPLF